MTDPNDATPVNSHDATVSPPAARRDRPPPERRPAPSLDNLVFLPAQIGRIPIEAHREPCATRTVLGTRFAQRPLELKHPLLIAGMSYGALSREAKVALAMAASQLGTAANSGAGGLLPEERREADLLVYQCGPGRFGFTLADLLACECIELVMGYGSNPTAGEHLAREKVTAEVSKLRGIPPGIDLRAPTRHPDISAPSDLALKVEELREATDWRVPVCIKLAAGRVTEDVQLAVKCGADIIAIDGCGGRALEPSVAHLGLPIIAAIPAAVRALEELGAREDVQLIAMGELRSGADAAKALALGADAVALGTSLLTAMGCIGCGQCYSGGCPVGIATHDPESTKKLDVHTASDRVAVFLRTVATELALIAKAVGKTNVHSLEPEDLRALDPVTAAIAQVQMVGR